METSQKDPGKVPSKPRARGKFTTAFSAVSSFTAASAAFRSRPSVIECRPFDFTARGGDFCNDLFSMRELRAAFDTRDHTAPGPDDI